MASNTTSTSQELRPRSPWGEMMPFWSDLAPWSSRMHDLMQEMWPTTIAGDFAPGGELHETDEAFVLEVDLPGVEKKDITIDISGRRLSVQGVKEKRERDGVLRHSTRTSGSFTYEAILPVPVDEEKVTAELADGVLTVTLPKATEARPKHIEIT